MAKKKVLVGMSGGVDSSVAAALLVEQGYEVAGITMQIWDDKEAMPDVAKHACYGPGEEEEIAEAARVARLLNIPFHVVNLAGEYRAHILSYFKDEYLCGRTPNPCVKCNREMKFGLLLEQAKISGIGFDHFATGHYVRSGYDRTRKRYILQRGIDPRKDQSYFLSFLSQEQLSLSLFPLGHSTKPQVRQKSADLGLGVERLPESQNFVAGDYKSLFDEEAVPGLIKDTKGMVLGEHQGIHHYTIGQRKGLGIPSAGPLYVVGIDHVSRTVTVGPKELLHKTELTASNLNLVSIDCIREPMKGSAKIRYNHECAATIQPGPGETAKVIFDTSQSAVTPGQVVVFYDDDLVIAGGIIEK